MLNISWVNNTPLRWSIFDCTSYESNNFLSMLSETLLNLMLELVQNLDKL